MKRWIKVICERKIIAERAMDLDSYASTVFLEFLDFLKLGQVVKAYGGYSEKLMEQFYSNLLSDNLDAGSCWFNKVYLRKKIIDFSTAKINKFLGFQCAPEVVDSKYPKGFEVDDGDLISELSGRYKTVWDGSNAAAADLSSRYYFLFQIVVQCWIPSTISNRVTRGMAMLLYCLGTRRPVNLGLIIQTKVVRQDESKRTRDGFSYACLITNLAISQKIELEEDEDVVEMRPLVFSEKTLKNRNVKDLPWKLSIPVNTTQMAEDRIAEIDAKMASHNEQMRRLANQKVVLENKKGLLVARMMED